MTNDQIIIYQVSDSGDATIDVQISDDTVWLDQRKMAGLFNKDVDTIGLHIRNIYKEGELDAGGTTEEYSVVREEGGRTVKRKVKQYNLDVIISVGYRVKSQRGTQFRIWANGVLKDYLRKGFTINEKKLKEKTEHLEGLKKTVDLLGNVLKIKELTTDETTGLLKVVTDYSYALDVLDKYDHQQLTVEGTTDLQLFIATYEEAMKAIRNLKNEFGGSSLSVMKRMIPLKGQSERYTNPLAGLNFIQQ